ncbi:MAG: ABC transporter ATP-binding protein [Clostridium sp.]|uniref:ABC transporter ATP-binding protein n=1 Tax=Clostridium sp. TaxID=1506 RepID=UPI003F34A2D6
MIKVNGLSFSYPNSEEKVLNNINLDIEEGEFVLVCGKSGCGKSTLLRHFKPELWVNGEREGEVIFKNKNILDWSLLETAEGIGYVFQNPDTQIVTEKVYHELAFGLENLGVDTQIIRRRVAEMSSFFGIENWFRKNVNELSGGQKQLLNLASIIVMQPKVIILDEPTSQLDPIAAKEFLDNIARINKELGITIIITEHNLESIYSEVDKVIYIEDGMIGKIGNAQEVAKYLIDRKVSFVKSLPTAAQIYKEIETNIENHIPLTVREGKRYVRKRIEKRYIEKLEDVKTKLETQKKSVENPIIELRDVCFKYEKNSKQILNSVSLNIGKGEVYCILGGNGTGKSTTLGIIANYLKPNKGKVVIDGKNIKKYKGNLLYKETLVFLPQNPQALFVMDTLKEDFLEGMMRDKVDLIEAEKKIETLSERLNISKLLKQHPYDLSGGETQRAALCKVLLLNPKIILLDEPTKGLDVDAKEEIGELLNELKNEGITIVMVTHDIEFAAKYSDRCGMFFDGEIVSESNPKEFFGGNSFYTTVANKISREFFIEAISCGDVVELCRKNIV